MHRRPNAGAFMMSSKLSQHIQLRARAALLEANRGSDAETPRLSWQRSDAESPSLHDVTTFQRFINRLISRVRLDAMRRGSPTSDGCYSIDVLGRRVDSRGLCEIFPNDWNTSGPIPLELDWIR
jgi:hypothetical protein